MKKYSIKLKMALAALALLMIQSASAVPIEGPGNYKSHSMTSTSITFKCGWKWWENCWAISGGKIFVDDYKTLIGYACSPNSTPEDPTILTDDQIPQYMESGSVFNQEQGEMETWYTFNFVVIPN